MDLSKFEASLGYVVSSREGEGGGKDGRKEGKREEARREVLKSQRIPSAILKLSSYFHGTLPAL